MLYDGALRFINQASDAMAKSEFERQNEACKRAQDIIAELMSCLDLKNGGEIATNLFSLYSFAYDQLVQANMSNNPDALAQAATVLTELRESWAKIEQLQAAGGTLVARAS